MWDGENHMVMDSLYDDDACSRRQEREAWELEHADDTRDELTPDEVAGLEPTSIEDNR